MRIIIKATNIKLSRELRDFINEKIGELEKFLQDILKKEDVFDGRSPRAEAFVEVGKPSRHHKKGDIFYAECQIPLPGEGVRATAERENLKLAICQVKDELQRQLTKYKDNQKTRGEKMQREIKENLKLKDFV